MLDLHRRVGDIDLGHGEVSRVQIPNQPGTARVGLLYSDRHDAAVSWYSRGQKVYSAVVAGELMINYAHLGCGYNRGMMRL